jgi:hypothetical protein
VPDTDICTFTFYCARQIRRNFIDIRRELAFPADEIVVLLFKPEQEFCAICVLFGNPGEILSLRHDSTDRSAYMPGVLSAIRGIQANLGFHVGLDAILKL